MEPRYRVTGDFRLGDIRHNVADTSLMRQALGVGAADGPAARGSVHSPNWAREELQPGVAVPGRYEESLREIRERGLLHTASRG